MNVVLTLGSGDLAQQEVIAELLRSLDAPQRSSQLSALPVLEALVDSP